ncbi:MAG: hypothetical protein AABZ00_00155 [Chloroflexota bacterium]
MPSIEKLGLSAFSTKKAETEPWLIQRAFVPPPDFEFLKGDHSTVIFGEPGSGKTASCLALEQYGITNTKRLIVRWHPVTSEKVKAPSTSLAMDQLLDILCSCVRIFGEKLSKEPSLLFKAAPATQEYLVWFVKRFADKKDFLETLPSALSKKEKDQFNELNERFPHDLFEDDFDPMVVATEFTKAMEMIGFASVWIMVDGVEWVTENQRKSAVNSLRSLLSTLKMFNIPYLSFKMALPMEFEAELADAIAITRDRAMVFRLSWDEKYLSSIIERRLAVTVGDVVSIGDIYNTEEVNSWLMVCGGSNPRGWLEYFRPLVSTYWDIVSSGKSRRLSKAEWKNARSRSSLNLKFDPETNQIRVGMGAVKMLSAEVGAIFSYLYKNQGRYCTKKELYYKAYVPFAVPEDKIKDFGEQFTLSKEYDDLINTVIYRIRQIVEPNPKDKEPVFVTSKRDMGIRLSTQAFQ